MEPLQLMVCINESCHKCGDRTYGNKCKDCGGDLYPYDDFEWIEVDTPETEDQILTSDGQSLPTSWTKGVQSDLLDDYDGTQEDFQDRLLHLAQQPGRSGHQHHQLPMSNYPNVSWKTANTSPSPSSPTSISGPPIPRVPAKDTFSCPSDLSGCPIASAPTVNVPWDLYNQWIYFARNIDTEWIAYLKGKQTNNEYTIQSMYFPPQRANAGHVEAEDGHIQPGTIAAVHSHVGMRVFFSDEDLKHMNHPVEMVVNRDGHILANARIKLECGRFHRGTANVRFTGNLPSHKLQQLKSVINQPQPATNSQQLSSTPTSPTSGQLSLTPVTERPV